MKLIRACLLVTLSLVAFGNAQAACNAGGVSCMAGPLAGQKQCSRTVMCEATTYGSGAIGVISSSGPVSCTGGGNFTDIAPFSGTLVAIATATATYHQCSWTWSSFTTISSSTFFDSIQISTSDGLPVELMGFSIPDSD